MNRIHMTISFPFVLLKLKYRGETLISSLEVGAQEFWGSLRGSLFIELLQYTLARAAETLMTHVSPSSSSLCFDWLELQRWHAPAASASLKALILHSKLFNSHIKTCKIWLRPRWRSASFVSMQTLAGDNRCCGEWRLIYSHGLWVFQQNRTITWTREGALEEPGPVAGERGSTPPVTTSSLMFAASLENEHSRDANPERCANLLDLNCLSPTVSTW